MDLAALFKQLFLFSRLEPEEIEQFSTIMREKVIGAGTKICAQGEQGSSMYTIQTGTCEVIVDTGSEEKVVATLNPGDFFGEVSLFDFAPRSATVRATDETTVMEITKEAFDGFVQEQPEIAGKILYSMMEEMARRLRQKVQDDFFF